MYRFIQKNEKNRWRTTIMLLLPMLFLVVGLNAQNLTIKGKALDPDGNALPGVAVVVKGTTIGATTNDDGDYVLSNVPKGSTLEFLLVGYVTQEIKVSDKTTVNVILLEASQSLDEVTIVAFGAQTRESVVASVSTINTKELKVPSSNLTTAFAGRIAGLISYQRTGEPGLDNAEFFIRGVTTFGTGRANPLILIDGVEMTADDLARLTTDDISSFSIMKDANATALYGARGANGVILVNTKEGREGKAKVQLRIETSRSSPTETLEYADPVTYMKLHNEARRTRNALVSLPYPTGKIYNTERGIDPLYYPAVNWQDLMFNDHTYNQRYNLNVSGGGTIARYYIAASYSKDNGIINVDKRNDFNNNIDINRYVLRSNVNVNITKTTEAIVRLHGAFDDYSGPLDGGADLYKKAMNANPVYFLPYYPADEANKYTQYILFGNYEDGKYLNPYAEAIKGFKSSNRSNMLAQFELKQNLDFIVKGLSARALFNVNRYSNIELSNSYKPFFFYLPPKITPNDEYRLQALNPTGGTDYLSSSSSGKDITSSMYFETAIQYNREFAGKHTVSGLLVYTMRESLDGNATDLQSSLPYRNLGLAGRLTYSYDSRYFIESNFGYNGSERFAASERFGFFPSIGGGWIVSNEKFMKPLEKIISKLKLKATYGLVGNDAIGSARFFYLSKVNMTDGNRGFRFGTNLESPYKGSGDGTGISIGRYSDPNITWEISRKTNYGLELNLWNALEIQLDYFLENRSKILQQRSYIPTSMGLQGESPSSNVGKANGSGIDLSVDYNRTFTKNFWAVVRGNFTYASSKYEVYDEPDYTNTPWRRHERQKISQTWGFVAERLFLDDNEVNNSPPQFGGLGSYMAGDIKYKDINGDFVVDDNDQVPIGYPTTPEIIYGFGISAGFMNLDFSCFFQGSARSSFWINPERTAPFVNRSGEKVDANLHAFTTNRAMLQYWVDDHWSEDNRNIYALWPRLSDTNISNNQKTSTWFMRDGSFLRLKTAEIGYSLPTKWISHIKVQSARFYVSGSNLLLFSKFKMWDPEMAGNGLAYPLQRVFNLGLNIGF
jgi:TonB-linked SusC/RagA family outer membrane protein